MVGIWIKSYGAPLLSVDERAAMVRHAYDQGVRYFDTARVYYESESIMGKGLKGVRDKVFLATKVATAIPARFAKAWKNRWSNWAPIMPTSCKFTARPSRKLVSRGR